MPSVRDQHVRDRSTLLAARVSRAVRCACASAATRVALLMRTAGATRVALRVYNASLAAHRGADAANGSAGAALALADALSGRAIALCTLGRWQEAAQDAARAVAVLRRLPADARQRRHANALANALHAQGYVLLRLGRGREAVDALRETVGLRVSHVGRSWVEQYGLRRLLVDLGCAHRAAGDVDEAIRSFTLAVHGEERKAALRATHDASLGLALAYTYRGDLNAGRGACDAALSDFERAARCWADVAAWRDDEEVRAQGVWCLAARARLLLGAGRAAEAAAACDAVMAAGERRGPNAAGGTASGRCRGASHLAPAVMRSGGACEAVAAALGVRAQARQRLGLDAEALADYEAAVCAYAAMVDAGAKDVCDGLLSTAAAWGEMLAWRGRDEAAIDAHTTALMRAELADTPDMPSALRAACARCYADRADSLERVGRHEEALADYDRALAHYERLVAQHGREDVAPNWVRTVGYRAGLLAKSGRAYAAVASCQLVVTQLERALSRQGPCAALTEALAGALAALGHALHVAGRRDDARHSLDRALSLYHELNESREASADAAQAYASLLLACPIDGVTDASAAVAAAERAVEITGGCEPAALDTLAEALFAAGDVEGAVRTEERVARLVDGTTGPIRAHVEAQRARFGAALSAGDGAASPTRGGA